MESACTLIGFIKGFVSDCNR